MTGVYELAAGASLVAGIGLVCFAVPLWVAARPLSMRRRLASLLCPASQVAVVALAHAAVRAGSISDGSALVVAFLALACAVLDVMVVRAFVEAEEADAARRRARAAEEQVAAQREHLRTLARARNEASELRERAASLFAAVADALERGERGRALELLREGEPAAAPVRAPCANPVAAALLSAKATRCDELGIAWRCRCELPERLGLPNEELCALLSNLLDNAIEAARTCGCADAFVRSVVRVSHGFLSVRVENSYAPDDIAEEKRQGGGMLPEHGWGMRIVELLVRARDGELTVSRADGVWCAHAIVRLD